MNVADVRKQVVFNLKIKASNVPTKNPATLRKVGSGPELMYSPVVFKSSIRIRIRIFSSINDMGRLENNRQNEAGDKMHDKESGKDPVPGKW